jgi:hypothetical protein
MWAFPPPSQSANSRFKNYPEDDCCDRQQCQKADDPDPGCELKGEEGEGEGGEQVGEQRAASGGAGRDVARQTHHFSPGRR